MPGLSPGMKRMKMDILSVTAMYIVRMGYTMRDSNIAERYILPERPFQYHLPR